MDRFDEVFKARPAVLPVIHVVDEDQVMRNIFVAQRAGSNGVFLINHKMIGRKFLDIYEIAADRFSDFWIGINCLDLRPGEIFNEVARRGLLNLAGIWTDNALINEYSEDQSEAERINELRQNSGWKGLYFGGVAFKYQPLVRELEKAAILAAKYVDVVTTSGPGTGRAAEIEKIRRMKTAVGAKPLAIASGITPDNVRGYLKITDCFLAATGISEDFFTLDPQKIRSLIKKAREEI